MKKRTFSFRTIALFASIMAALFTAIIFSAITSQVSNEIHKITINQLQENYMHISSGYSQSVELCIQNYYSILDYFIDSGFLENASTTQIDEFLRQHGHRKPVSMQNIYYADKTGRAKTQSGKIFNISDRKYFKEIFENGKDEYTSDPIYSKLTNDPLIVVSKAVKDKAGNVKGLMNASIPIDEFAKVLDEIKIDTEGDVFILDSDGRFIYNDDPAWTLKTFENPFPGYGNYSTANIVKYNIPFMVTTTPTGVLIDVFYHPIDGTGWGVGIYVNDAYIHKTILMQKKLRRKIIIETILVLIVLFCLFNQLFRIIQKSQILRESHDSLTGLWNRQLFEKEAERMLKRSAGKKFLMIESDIRGFKFINQNFGGQAADNVIRFYAKLISRISSDHKGLVCRGYADHFYGFFKVKSVRTAMEDFNRNIQEINNRVKHFEVPFNAKFGLSFYLPETAKGKETVQTLIGEASFAKSTIKDDALSQCAIYNSRLLKKVNRERYIEQHMENALSSGEFFVMYQPKIKLSTDKIVGAEALVRWRSPELGLMPPDSFIPLFEKNGFVTRLDFFVYEQVFKFLRKELDLGHSVVPVSVNMSRKHSRPEKFYHDFYEIFSKYNLPPELVQVEILERSVMDGSILLEITNLLHKGGFTVAMDDFGTGESSLNMLTKIPVDVLKFDRTFLLSSTNEKGKIDKKNADFIETLVNLSRNLEKETIFEGVETEEQRDFLKSINCDLVQGYFYSKPLDEEDFKIFLKNRI